MTLTERIESIANMSGSVNGKQNIAIAIRNLLLEEIGMCAKAAEDVVRNSKSVTVAWAVLKRRELL